MHVRNAHILSVINMLNSVILLVIGTTSSQKEEICVVLLGLPRGLAIVFGNNYLT